MDPKPKMDPRGCFFPEEAPPAATTVKEDVYQKKGGSFIDTPSFLTMLNPKKAQDESLGFQCLKAFARTVQHLGNFNFRQLALALI